jgi:hypothetical protein
MSGEKRRYIRVDEAELQRLRQQESRLRSVQQDLPERLNAVARQTRQEMQQRLRYLEEREGRQEEKTRQLRSHLANVEDNLHQQLRQQRQQFQSALQETQLRQEQLLDRQKHDLELAMHSGFEQQRQEYLRLTQEQRQEYQQLIGQERQAREKGQQVLQQQIEQITQDIHQDRERKQKLAEDLLADVQDVWSAIDRDYQHQRFAPGELEKLQRSLEIAKNNIAAGVTEAAIATSQKTYLDLVDLRLDLEQKEQEWLLLYNAALQDIRNLIAEVQANRECNIEIGSDEDAEAFKLEVDYWSTGTLSDYEKELTEIETQLTTQEATLTSDTLKEFGAKIETLQPKFGEILEQAKLAILSSQLRAEIGDRVVEALNSLGYTLVNPEVDSIYEGDDPRKSYAVKVKNIAGDEVVTVVSPDRDFGVNSISINTFSPTLLDETATQQNSQAIFEVLDQEGVRPSGELVCNTEPRAEYENLQQFKQAKTQPADRPSS